MPFVQKGERHNRAHGHGEHDASSQLRVVRDEYPVNDHHHHNAQDFIFCGHDYCDGVSSADQLTANQVLVDENAECHRSEKQVFDAPQLPAA